MNSVLNKDKILIENFLEENLPSEKIKPKTLHQAMRYAVLNGGKKLRALLTIAACETVGGRFEQALDFACAIELIHSYSLIHDDLPCMDDDKLRRGKPTCHVKFGEAIALLAGDALLTLAFGWLANANVKNKERIPEAVSELAKAAGHIGMVGGQVADIELTGEKPSEENLLFIHHHKTADLIAASVVLGGIAGNAEEQKIILLKDFGFNLGMAFQFIDDILDCTATSEKLGKTVNKDENAGKITAVSLYGLEQAKDMAENYTTQARKILNKLETNKSKLSEISDFVIKRTF